MNSSPGELDPREKGLPGGTLLAARLWGTAHFTVAVLLVLALIWCVACVPGHSYDIRPLPVPAAGWLLWICGGLFLASAGALHARFGSELRRGGAVDRRESIVAALVHAVVTATATFSVFLGPSSRTHAFGLETQATTLLIASGLSTLLLVAAAVRRPGRLGPAPRKTGGVVALLTANVVFALAASVALVQVERAPISQQPQPMVPHRGLARGH